MSIHNLLAQTETTLSTLALSGFANAGPTLGEVDALADELTGVGLGRLGERLRAVITAADDRARTTAWVAAWSGIGLVRTRLLKPVVLDVQEAIALPQASNVLFPRPPGNLESPDGLLAALQSPQPLARTYAAGRLAEWGDAAVPGLLDMQKRCGRCIRFLAVETLGRIGTEAALSGLAGLLGDDDVARPLEAALLACGAKAIPPVAEVLAQAKDKDKKRRRAAAKLLWRLGGAQPLQAVLDDKDELVRACARVVLHPPGRWGGWGKLRALADWPAAVACFEHGLIPPETLIERLDALPKSLLDVPAAVLWHTGAEEPLLAHYLAQMIPGSAKKAREHAAAFIARLAHPAAAPILLNLAADEVHLAAEGLAELAESVAVWPLIQALHRLKQMLHGRIPLIAALGRIGDPAATPALLELLVEITYSPGRDAIEKALVAIGAPAVEEIARTLERRADATLERALEKIETPQAQAALAAYRAGVDELTRLIAHLADGKAPESVVRQIVRQGPAALVPLLDLLAKGSLKGRIAAARTLGQLAPTLDAERREQVFSALRAQLRAQHLGQSAGLYWLHDPFVEQLVAVLCDLDVSAALPEISDALFVDGVGEIVVAKWQQKQSIWLLDVIAQALGKPHSRRQTLHFAQDFPLNERTRPHLWPPVEAILRTETDAYTLMLAVQCLYAWGDGKALPLLRALKERLGTVAGSVPQRESLERTLKVALTELGLKNSPLGRLFGKR